VEVLFDPVARARLDDHPRPVRVERRADVARRASGVAHVVEGVEHRHEVVAAARVRVRGGDLERHAVGDAGLLGAPAGDLDRGLVRVIAVEPGARKRLCEQDRGQAVTAADVGDESPGAQLLLDAVERRNPLVDQARAVDDAEQALDAVEEVVVVLVPAEPAAGPERVDHALIGADRGGDRLEQAGLGERAELVGEHDGVLGRQRVAVRVRVVGDEAAGRLPVEPFAHVALVGLGSTRERGGAHGLGVAHRPVEAERVADADERRVHGRAGLVQDLLEERLELGVVDRLGGHRGGAP